MNIADIRAGIADAANGLGNLLRGVPYLRESVSPPSLSVGEARISYHQSMRQTMGSAGLVKVTFDGWLIVSRAADVQSQELLDSFLTPGEGSLIAALEGSDANGDFLGGAVQAVQVLDATTVMPTIGDTTYYGARLTVEVWA